MGDYTTTKSAHGALAPLNAFESVWGRLEPLITPEQLQMFHLFGIPLVSRTVNPFTKKIDVITPEMVKEYIKRAVNEVELDLSLIIMPTQLQEKLEYNRQDYDQFGFMQLNNKPVASLESMTIQLADGGDIFEFPLQWVETANLVYGQVNLLPLAYQTLTASGFGGAGLGMVGFGSSGVFFNSLWSKDWVPALFNMTYTAGFPDGLVPTWINELIGITAAMRVLSMLAATNSRTNSQSLSVDQLSQSISGPGAQVYIQRLTELKEQRDAIKKKVRALYNSNFVVTAI